MAKLNREQILNDFENLAALKQRKIELDEAVAATLQDYHEVEKRVERASSIECVVDGVALSRGYRMLGSDNIHVSTVPLEDGETTRMVYCYESRSRLHPGHWMVNTKYQLAKSWDRHEEVLGLHKGWTQDEAREVARAWLLRSELIRKLP